MLTVGAMECWNDGKERKLIESSEQRFAVAISIRWGLAPHYTVRPYDIGNSNNLICNPFSLL